MHTPVLLTEVLHYLNPQPNEHFIDCTAGGGGYTFAIAERTAPKGKILALDWDETAISRLQTKIRTKKLQSRIIPVTENFAHVPEATQKHGIQPVSGIVFDVGFSSDQLEAGKGFSFHAVQAGEPLDMRYNSANPVTAAKIVQYSNRNELAHMFKEYGEEQYADRIAHAIVQVRAKQPVQTTTQLVKIVLEATPSSYHGKKIHPATKTFQALRIATNREFENIAAGLEASVTMLKPGGRIVIVTFHSLEDRIAKTFFKQHAHQFRLLTKKPVIPTAQEIQQNPRARSAKLRAAEKQ